MSALNAQILLHDESARGQLTLTGRDRAALLQRLSTNDVVRPGPGQGAQTVLTNHNGRIIDLLTTLVLDDRLLLLTGPGRGPEVAGYLRRNIFFMDQLAVADDSADWLRLAVYGPQAGPALAELSGLELDAVPLWGHVAADDVRLVRIQPLSGAGWLLLAPTATGAALRERLLAGGAAQLDASAYATLRVEAGLPGPAELNLEYIPLETGLWEAVSFTKGCYTGQEIIARMESRGRLAKRLMGLRLAALPAALPAALLTPAGKDAGDVTSAVDSPTHGPIGLAYVRTAHAEPGTVLTVADQPASVVALPFGAHA